MLKLVVAVCVCGILLAAGLLAAVDGASAVFAATPSAAVSSAEASASPGGGGGVGTAASTAAGRQFRIFLMGNRRGAVRPCDCKDWQGGGMEREMTYCNLKSRDGIPAIKLDSGYFTDPTPTYRERLSTLFALMGLEYLQYDAINLSTLDMNLGLNVLRRSAELFGLPLISANILDPGTAAPLFPPSRELTVRDAGGREIARVGIVGIANIVPPVYSPGSLIRFGLPGITSPSPTPVGSTLPREYVVRLPLETLREHVPKLRERCSVVIVVSWLTPSAAREMARQVEGIDILVAGDYPEVPPPVDWEGNTLILSPGKDGMFINEALIRLDEKAGKEIIPSEPLWLGDSISKHPALTSFHQAHMVSYRECSADYSGTDHPRHFAGALTCRICHLEQYDRWKNTPHAGAFASLESGGQAQNPLCLSCHATALMQPGGFRSAAQTPEMTGVQCEACHGPARDHIAWAYRVWRDDFQGTSPESRNYNPKRLPRTGRALDSASCVKCHNPQNSPGFDFHRSKSRVCVGE
jgi:hypothetical protein